MVNTISSPTEVHAEPFVLISKSGAREFKHAKRTAPPWLVSHRAWVELSRYSLAFKAINGALNYDESLTERQLARVAVLDRALAAAPRLADPLTLYRGERWPRVSLKDGYQRRWRRSTLEAVPSDPEGLLGWARTTFTLGSELTFKGYASFSASPTVAARFTADTEKHRPAVLFRTTSTHFAHPGMLHALNMRESDVIFPRGTRASINRVSLARLEPPSKRWLLARQRKLLKHPIVLVDVALSLPGKLR